MTPALEGSRARVAVLLLLLVTAVWGSTFFLIRDLVRTLPSADFLSVRFAVAALGMFALFHRQTLALPRRQLGVGVLLGLVYGAAQLLQTVGLEHTAASVSGFVTGSYVVLTPLIGAVLLRDRISRVTWAATLLAMTGIAVLSLRGLAVGLGEGLTLASAVLYALHIVLLGRWSTAASALGLSTVQAATISVVCLLAAAPDGVSLPAGGGQWLVLLYMAFVAGAGALWAQTWAQAHVTAARAAVVMAMEPVFAAGFAVALGGESLTARMLLGGSLVVAAMYLVELRGSRPPEDRSAAEDPPAEALHHDV